MKYRDRKQQRKWRISAVVVVVVDSTVCCYFLLLFLLKERSCARSKKLFQKRRIKKGKKLKVSELYRPTFQLLIGTFQLESVSISATRLSVSRSLNLKISDFRIYHLTNECVRVQNQVSFFITFFLFSFSLPWGKWIDFNDVENQSLNFIDHFFCRYLSSKI